MQGHFRILAEQAFSRTAGAPLVPGNRARLLRDAGENFPAWLAAIRSARHDIHLECYVIRDDEAGHEFAEALTARARAGVRVRVIYDWFGALGFAPRRFWRQMRAAGVEVRAFNPPQFDSPFGWLSRDHRKMLTVDGRVGFVFGLCIDQRWRRDPGRGGASWRDTGIEIQGPVIADLDMAFSQMWAAAGRALPEEELADRAAIPEAGDVALRVVAGAPHTAELYRLDLLIAAAARRSLWLTDSYFVGTTPYVQALRAAALSGVDVRLLIPSNSDVPFTRAMTRSGYRALLEAGVRVFEWQGPMLHAKTAVADGCWARVGSTNLNLWSWVGNWELDVVAEDEGFARAMERMYEEDLTNAHEIGLSAAQTPHPPRGQGRRRRAGRFQVSGRSVTPGLRRIGRVIGMVITNQLGLEPTEAGVLAVAGLALLAFIILVIFWPWVAAAPLVVVGGWMALALLVRAYRLYAAGKKTADKLPAAGVLSQPAAGKVEPRQPEVL